MGFSRQEYWSGLPFPSPGEKSLLQVLIKTSDIPFLPGTWRNVCPHFLKIRHGSRLALANKVQVEMMWITSRQKHSEANWWLKLYFLAQMEKHLPTMQETWVQFLGREDLLEKEMATHSSILAWKIPWTEEPGRLQSMGLQRVGHDWVTKHLAPPGQNNSILIKYYSIFIHFIKFVVIL